MNGFTNSATSPFNRSRRLDGKLGQKQHLGLPVTPLYFAVIYMPFHHPRITQIAEKTCNTKTKSVTCLGVRGGLFALVPIGSADRAFADEGNPLPARNAAAHGTITWRTWVS